MHRALVGAPIARDRCMRPTEIWKPIPWTEGYYDVSNLGRVRRSPDAPARQRARPGAILRPATDTSGRLCVNLRFMGRSRMAHVARLVAEVFVGPPPSPGACLGFRDGDRLNCAARNLLWTQPSRRLSAAAVAKIRQRRGMACATDLARDFEVSPSTIRNVWVGRTYRDI
jgi:hypothetical protein